MISVIIGTGTKDKDSNKSYAMQTWLEAHGISVYLPQRRHNEADNLSVEWDAATGGLRWQPATVNHLALLPAGQMVMAYNAYYQGAGGVMTWRTVGWPDPANLAKRLTQDELTLAQMTAYLTGIRIWLEGNGIGCPLIFVDEPPHRFDGPIPSKYGWSPECEARVVKWVTACLKAGFMVLVAMPGPSQLRFWAARLPGGVTWALNEAHPLAEYDALPKGAAVWVYNVRAASWPRLANVLASYNAVGLLQWSAVPWVKDNELPLLFDISGTASVPTDAAWVLLEQLQAYDRLPSVMPATWQEAYQTLDARLRKGGL